MYNDTRHGKLGGGALLNEIPSSQPARDKILRFLVFISFFHSLLIKPTGTGSTGCVVCVCVVGKGEHANTLDFELIRVYSYEY